VDALTLLNIALAVINVLVAIFQAWKEWHAHQDAPHPLAPALADVAEAVRELRREDSVNRVLANLGTPREPTG
jgi:hypothetical protein